MKKEQFFRETVKTYYDKNKRDFFWRQKGLEPYQIFITEILLKKTKAETINKYMFPFINEYHNNQRLYKETKKILTKKIYKLGLVNQRSKALKEISKYIHFNYDDVLPNNLDKLIKIPHVGFYTANATLCFGFHKKSPVLDVNTSRIISRYFSIDNTSDLRINKELQLKAIELLPRKKYKEYNWGLFDLGALTCKPKPLCDKCPLSYKCNNYLKNK